MTKEKLGLTILKIHDKTRFIWMILIPIMMVFLVTTTLLAAVGLAYMANYDPNAFHGRYINYHNLWIALGIWPILGMAFIIIPGIAILVYPTSQKTELKDRET